MALNDHSASGSNAGFIYQFERALYWLAKSPAAFLVGIETDDDVAVRGSDNSQVLEQDKHSIRDDAEPFGNRSKDLWNTLAIWLEALDSDQIKADATIFIMVTNKVLPECIARNIGLAESEPEIDACIAALKSAGEDPPRLIASKIERVLRTCSRANLRSLISKCELVDGAQAAAGRQLRTQTVAHLQLPAWCSTSADSIADELLGWLQRTALDSWRQNRPAWIQRDNFVNQLHAVINRRKREITRERAENLIPVTNEKIGETKGSLFVKQLHWVTDDDTIVDSAIREFIRCNVEKSRLSAEGNITDEDWISFETALMSRWEKIRHRIIRIKKTEPENDVGFEIFTETTEEHREKLAGSDTEQVYLTSGTYHRLADMVRVGWHPKFEQLVKKLKEKHD